MAQTQNEKEALLCTHGDCKELQTEDGEFCAKHYPKTNKELIDEIYATIDGMDDDGDNQTLSEAMDYYCNMSDVRAGYAHAIRLTIENDDTSERNYETNDALARLLEILKR